MNYFLDSNIFLRVIMREDKKTAEECEKILEKIKTGDIQAGISNLVLVEIGWVLRSYYKVSREKVAQSLMGIRNMDGLEIFGDQENWDYGLGLFSKFNVKLTDALIASYTFILDKSWIIVSYDEDFKKLPVKWLKPGQV